MRSLALGLLVLLAPSIGRAEVRSDRPDEGPVVVERIVAVVDGRPILLSQLRRAERALALSGERADRRLALDRLIDQVLFEELCEREGGVTNEHVDRAIAHVRRQSGLGDRAFEEAIGELGFTMQAYRAEVRRQLCVLSAVNRRLSDSSDHERVRRELTRELRARATIDVRL